MPMDSAYDDRTLLLPDCSIRKSTDITLTYSSPWLIAVSHVLLRLSVPRHSPCALCSLTFLNYQRSVVRFVGGVLLSADKMSSTSYLFALRAFSLPGLLSLY